MLVRGSSGDEGTFISQRDATNIIWQIYNLTATSSGQTWVINIGNQTINVIGNSTTANDDKWHMIHVCLKFGTEVQLFVDGVADTLGVKAETRTPYSGAISMTVGMRWSTKPATGFERTCDVAFAGLWNRRLSAGEIANHAKSPWQLFSAQPIIGVHKELQPEDHRLITLLASRKISHTNSIKCIDGAEAGDQTSTFITATLSRPPPPGSFVVAIHHQDQTPTTPSERWDGSWTSGPIAGETASVKVYWKIARGGDPASYTFNYGSSYARCAIGVFEIPPGCKGVSMRSGFKHDTGAQIIENRFIANPELGGSQNGELLISFTAKDQRFDAPTVIFDTWDTTDGYQSDDWTLGFDGNYGKSVNQSIAVSWRFDRFGRPTPVTQTEDAVTDYPYAGIFAFAFDYADIFVPIEEELPDLATFEKPWTEQPL
jgi:hypothetical protein